MTSISDVGEEMDIHPKDKKTVGHRLAGMARHYVYGENILCEAPRPQDAKREGNTVVVTFQYAGSGLKLVGEDISALEVLQNGKRVPHTAKIEHDKLCSVHRAGNFFMLRKVLRWADSPRGKTGFPPEGHELLTNLLGDLYIIFSLSSDQI